MWNKLAVYSRRYPARISGYVSAISLNAMKYWANVPVGFLIPIAMLLIMMGEGSQRLEDKKTLKALYTKNNVHKADQDIIDSAIINKHQTTHNKGKH